MTHKVDALRRTRSGNSCFWQCKTYEGALPWQAVCMARGEELGLNPEEAIAALGNKVSISSAGYWVFCEGWQSELGA